MTKDFQKIDTARLGDFDSSFMITTNKLDADQYRAEDLDGEVENIFGTGSMAYASLQASQTDDVLNSGNISSPHFNQDFVLNSSGNGQVYRSNNGLTEFNNDEVITSDNGPDSGSMDGQNLSSDNQGDFSSTTVGSLGASQLSSDFGSFAQAGSGLSLSNGLNGSGGADGFIGSNGFAGESGSSGTNGSDGENADNPEMPPSYHHDDVTNIINVNLGDITVILNQNLIDLGDTISTLSTTIISVTNNVENIVENLVDVNQAISQVSNLVVNLTSNVTDIVTEITCVTENIDNLICDILEVNPVSVVTDIVADLNGVDVLGTVIGELNGSIVITKNIIGHLVDNVFDIKSGASEELVNNLTDTLESLNDVVVNITPTVDNILVDTLDSLGLGGGTGNNPNNTDGDSDITADLGLDIVNHDVVDAVIEAVIDPVEDVVGDIDIDVNGLIDLFNNTEIDNENGDHDITLTPDIDLINTDLVDGAIDVELDVVENLIGDIDLDIGAALDIFGEAADPVVNDGAGGTGEDNILSHLGDNLNAVVSDVLPNLGDGDGADDDLTLDTNIGVVDNILVDTEIEAVLDPVENIIGDLDIDIGVNTNILGSDETDNSQGDSDLTLDQNIDVLGVDVVDIDLDIPLDIVENITGDIDIDVSSAFDLLNSDNPENEMSDEGDSTPHWTESTITDGGGLFGDFVNATDGLGDCLPDPVGTIAEGIGALNIEPDLDLGSLGGLFG